MRAKESRPSTGEAIMAALTVPHDLDAETPQHANVIDGLHAVVGIATIGIGFDDEI